MRFPICTAAFALLLLPVAAQQPTAGAKAADCTFPQFVNGDGRQQLSDFYGQPVVIDQWGTHCPPCIGIAVPNAIRHDHEFADQGLVTILVECQGADAKTLEAFLWKHWPDNQCFACVNVGVPLPHSPGIPFSGVIGVDGTLLWAGSPVVESKKMDDLIAAELDKVKKGWGTTPAQKKVRAALFGKDNLASAAALVAALPEGEERAMLQAEVDARYATKKRAVTTLQEQGNWLGAHGAAKNLLKSVGTQASWVAEVQPLVAQFDADEHKAEMAAAKKLDKIVQTLRNKKGDGAPKALEALVKDAGSTKAGARAQQLLDALRNKPAD